MDAVKCICYVIHRLDNSIHTIINTIIKHKPSYDTATGDKIKNNIRNHLQEAWKIHCICFLNKISAVELFICGQFLQSLDTTIHR